MASSRAATLLRRTRVPFSSDWVRALSSCVPEAARAEPSQNSKTFARNTTDTLFSSAAPVNSSSSPTSSTTPSSSTSSSSSSSTSSTSSSFSSLDKPRTLAQLRSTLASEPRPILTDTFGRKHSYLRISLTERCNLRCQYCMPEEGVALTPGEELLTTAEIVKLAGLFVDAGVDKIRFTGGEPTVRKDILDIISQVNTLRPRGLKTIGMTTNGIVLAKKLPDFKAAGLDTVNISLDTFDPNLFQIVTRRNGHDKVMASIEAAIAQMPPGAVKVNCVVMRGVNDQEIVDFVRWTEKRNVEVRFIEFMPFDGNKFSRQKFFSFQDMKERIQAALPLEVLPAPGQNEVAKVYHVPGFLGRVGFITSMSEHFCDTCNRLRITADGNLKVCLFGQTEVSLRDILREDRTDEQIREVIGMAVSRKKAKHAGMDNLAKMKNRPMITIGG